MQGGSAPLTEEEWAEEEACFRRADVDGSGKVTIHQYVRAYLTDNDGPRAQSDSFAKHFHVHLHKVQVLMWTSG